MMLSAATYLYPAGSVYVLENRVAQRVKVGRTAIGASDVADRLKHVNDTLSGTEGHLPNLRRATQSRHGTCSSTR